MATQNLVINTKNGPVKGFIDTHPVEQYSSQSSASKGHLPPVLKWLGIPYASATRFQRPTDPKPWQQDKECFEFGTMFPQPQGMTEQLLSKLPGFVLRSQIKQSEQSHFVNVFVPGDYKQGEQLPVMVFIYGGALNTGSSDRYFYDPTSLIRSQSSSQRCIVVTGNYRINIFGFLSCPELSNADSEGLSGNYGLYDCVKLFEWVQENISNFGGNPREVTAFGQSAGAFLISYLLVSGKRLFNRAILQSGAQKTMGMRSPSSAYPALPQILSSLQQQQSPSSSSQLDLLNSATTSQLLSLHTSNHSLESISLTIEPSTSLTSIWTPSTISRLESGSIDPWIDSLILGTTEDEGSVFAYGAKLSNPTNFDNWIGRFDEETRKQAREKYLKPFNGTHPGEGECELRSLPGSRLLSDQIFVNPVWELAKAVQRNGGGKVWLYRLRTGVKGILDNSPFGIMHSMDLPLIFNCSALWSHDLSSNDAKTSRALGSRWLNYGVTGQPDQEWIPFEVEKEKASWLVFSEGGVTKNESLSNFEEGMVRLVVEPRKEEEGIEEGDETLGATNE